MLTQIACLSMALLSGLINIVFKTVVADKGYDSEKLREFVREQ
jgi:hypothetical protein